MTEVLKTSFNQFLIQQLFAVSITGNIGQDYVKVSYGLTNGKLFVYLK